MHHSTLSSLLALTYLVLSSSPAAAFQHPQGPAPPQPASLAKKPFNPFLKRQTTREQIIKRQKVRRCLSPSSNNLLEARSNDVEPLVGKQRLNARENGNSGPSASPRPGDHDTPCAPPFYLEYCNSGMGADSQFASIQPSTDESESYLLPVLEKTSATLFTLANGQLVAEDGVVGFLADGGDLLSFEERIDINEVKDTIVGFSDEGDKLTAEGENVTFNLCSTHEVNNILHLSPADSVPAACHLVTMRMIYA